MKQLKAGLIGLFLIVSPAAMAQEGVGPRAPTTPVITTDPGLLADFGGREGLVRIMDDFMVNLLQDPRTEKFFGPTDKELVKLRLVEQFCVMMSGPCAYSGRSMQDVHLGMGVKTAEFYALVEALQKSMTKNKVPFASQNRLVAALAPMHRDIIDR